MAPINQSVNQDSTGADSVTDRADGIDGATAPTLVTQVGGKDGSGNLQTLLTDTTGAVAIGSVSGTVTIQGTSGSAGTSTGGILSVQGVSGGTPQPVTSRIALTPSSPATASIGVTSAIAVTANANRKGLVLTNVSVNRISFGIGATAVLNSGITLYPGGVWVMDEYTYSTSAINAIASVASSALSIQEFT